MPGGYRGTGLSVRKWNRIARGYGSSWRAKKGGGSRTVVAGSMRYRPVKAVRDYPLYAPSSLNRRQEMKTKPQSLTTLLMASDAGSGASGVLLLNNIAQADSLITRTTNRIMMLAVVLRLQLSCPPTATALSDGGLALVYDRQPNKTAVVVTDVFESQMSNAFQTVPYRQRFLILWRKQWDFVGVQATSSTLTTKSFYAVEIKIPIHLEAVYSGATGAIGEHTLGSLYLITLGNTLKGAGSNECPYVVVSVRTQFCDR